MKDKFSLGYVVIKMSETESNMCTWGSRERAELPPRNVNSQHTNCGGKSYHVQEGSLLGGIRKVKRRLSRESPMS